ncbi:hypothetical protein B0A54_14480 [Friedmanniomyces endolithicus]|uniref:ESCRT-II complex subunit VPS25 n=1 Tax=Friedmanniomyces endolithicus TaxID=329885 RepID=A0A4V5N5L5_9PEZI|nr:hypothetical protein B0A54_14480 [Friedmanniomyces endolithicus]
MPPPPHEPIDLKHLPPYLNSKLPRTTHNHVDLLPLSLPLHPSHRPICSLLLHRPSSHTPQTPTTAPQVALPPTTTATTSNSTFPLPPYTLFPPFYTLQPNHSTLARQLLLWSTLLTSYAAHTHLFKLSLSSPPPDLFSNATLHRSLKQSDIRQILDYMALPANGSKIEWLPPPASSSGRKGGEQSSTCWVWWRSAGEWADRVYEWVVEETGQRGAVLTVWELRAGEGVKGREWEGMEEGMLRRVLGVLVKRGKAQVFGEGEGSGVKFF